MRNYGLSTSLAALMVLFGAGAASAGVYWLPDYLGDNSGRINDCAGGNCDGAGDYACESYGYVRSCPSPKISRGPARPIPGLNCEKGCYCPGEYNQSCSGNYEGSGIGCDGLYQSCQCKSTFIYDSSNCKSSEGYKLGSNLCGGKSDRCEALDCTVGGYFAEKQDNRKCSEVSYGGKTCYSCYQPECGEGGYKASVPANNKCTPVTYYGRTCQGSCYQPGCAEGGYKDSVPANNKCTEVTYYGRTCQSGCYQPSCSEGKYQASVPANNKCTEISYYGRTCQKDCYQPTCSAGGYEDSVPAGYSCTPVTYYGRPCQKDCKLNCANECSLSSCPVGSTCRREDCSGKYCVTGCAANYKSCNGTCISEQICCNNTCVWPAVCNDGKCEKCNGGSYHKGESAKVPSDCRILRLLDYAGNGVSYYIPADNNNYSAVTLYAHGPYGNNAVMDIYGDLNINGEYLSLIPPISEYGQVCDGAAVCNATINFHGKVTLNGDLYLVTKIISKYVTYNQTVNFKQGLSGNYTCKKTGIESWSSGTMTFTNYCPNGGPII